MSEPTSRPSLSVDSARAGDVRRVLAWGVHLLTASGAAFGTLALLQIAYGNFRGAGLLMLVTLAIDAVDGTLARAVGVERVVPQIDGRRLDDMVDYFNYVIVPAFFLVQTGGVSHWAWVIAPILSSAYGFSRQDAKTEDDFFLGFPSYWNIVALYIWLLGLSPLAGTLWIVGLSAAVFVPIKFLYPSKMHKLRGPTIVGGIIWGAVFSACIADPELAKAFWLPELSLTYMAYYWILSFWMGGLKTSEGRHPS